MGILSNLFGRRPSAEEEGEARQAYVKMREAMARETPEQKERFYLEVAAQMGNKSAADRLAKLGADPERKKPN